MAEPRKKLSPSAINTFYTCGFSYHCRYNLHSKQILTPDTFTFGTTIHSICDAYYDKITTKTKPNEIHDILELLATSLGNYSTTSRKRDTRTALASFETFEKKRMRNGIGMPTVREKMMTAKIRDDLPLIYGKTDLYFEDDGHIIDWKTGKCSGISDSLKIQGKAYEILLKANGYNPKKVTFNYLVAGKRITLPEVSMGWFVSKLEDMVSDIKKDKFRKQHSGLCTRWCGYRLACDLENNCGWFI